MSSKTSSSKIHNNYNMLELKLSKAIVSFKELLSYIEIEDIYSGKEETPFKEKHFEFRQIMLSEFID